jgi:predicted nuclease of predicted toxin-antitoxin system
MQFETDENLRLKVAEILVESGYDAVWVDQQGLARVANAGVAAVCLVEGRAIVTLDTDFSSSPQ